MTNQLVHHHFVDEYDPTIDDSYRKQATVDGETCLWEIVDTAGQEEYAVMRDHYMKSGAGFILAYAITTRSSFDEIATSKEKICRVREVDKVPMCVVGNKCDLENERQVQHTEGADIAKNWGVPFFETSAKSGFNVEEAFFELVREIRKENAKNPGRVRTPNQKSTGLCNLL